MLHQPPAQLPAPHVSLVAPIYNEEKNIPIFLGNLLQVLDALGRRFEIIAVDDGSADGSKAELACLIRRGDEFGLADVA